MTPAQHLEELTSLYEREAYVVWNVALRTSLSEERATDAAKRAFLAQVTSAEEQRVAFDAARLAAEASQPVDPRAIEDDVLAASARLAPAQRAALALAGLADASPAAIAGLLGIDEEAERDLRRRSLEQLGTLLGVSAGEAQVAYDELVWEAPPDELWAALYPEIHAAVTRKARSTAEPAEPPAPAARKRRWRRGAPRVAVAALVVLIAAGVALAASGGGSSRDDDAAEPARDSALSESTADLPASEDDNQADAGQATRQLTPEELDRLRAEEVRDLKRFTRRKQNEQLPRRERRQAARKVSDIVKLAQARQRAAERRELALRRALAREREARIRERNRRREESREESAPEPSPGQEAPEQPKPQPESKPDRRSDREPDRDQTEAECLYDASSGAYICPE